MNYRLIPVVLVMVIVACTPPPIVEEPAPVVEEPVEEPVKEPEEISLEPEPIEEKPTIIAIQERTFEPKELAIPSGTEVTWEVKDGRKHKIACYQGGLRVFTSDNFKDEYIKSITYNGDLTCIDAIYGLRGKITVYGAPQEGLLSPTGEAITSGPVDLSKGFFAFMVLLAILGFGYIYMKKKNRK